MQASLFKYPNHPGWRRTDTSKAAAEDIAPKQKSMQERVLECLERKGPLTSEEIAEFLDVDYRTTQPRTSELRRLGKIEDTGRRRKSARTGKRIIVWGLK